MMSSHGGWRPAPSRFLDILDSPYYRLIVDIQDALLRDSANFWSSKGVRYMFLPVTTGSISSPMGLGSDSVPVKIDLMGEPTYLADSMQFMLEYGCRLNSDGAWYLMPSFRGEEADETHLNQFFHSEAEIIGDLEAVFESVESYVRGITAGALQCMESTECGRGMDLDHIRSFLDTPNIPRINMDDAVKHLHGDDSAVIFHDGYRTVTRHGERRLMSEIAPVLWLTHHDHKSVPFYQAYADEERQTAACGDLLFGIGEVVGSGQRHETAEQVLDALADHGVDPQSYSWYVEMKRAKPLKTAGFGLGVERWMQWLLSAKDIRELQLVPRLNGVTINP
jgi:asparaginyl-tRNA synthetase